MHAAARVSRGLFSLVQTARQTLNQWSFHVVVLTTTGEGSLRNDDGYGKDNAKKQ